MVQNFVSPDLTGQLAKTSGTETLMNMTYEVIMEVYIEKGFLCCKKTMKSSNMGGISKNEHLIVPKTLDEMLNFFGQTKVSLDLYLQLPERLTERLLEGFPYAPN